MNALFKLFGIIDVDNENANESIDSTTDKAEKSQSKMGSAFSAIGGAALKLGTAVVGAGAAIGGALIAVTEETREYRVAMGKLDTAFVTSGLTSKNAKDTYMDLQSVLGDTDVSVEAANHLAKLCDNQKDLEKWTDICTGVFATFGDSIPIEGLTEAANETAKVGALTGPLADALNWAGIAEDDFQASLDKCNTEQERAALITSTMTKLYSDASEQYQETNKDIIDSERAQARLTDAMARFGAIGEPIVARMKNTLADMAETVLPYIEIMVNKFFEFTDSFPKIDKAKILKQGLESVFNPETQSKINDLKNSIVDFGKSFVTENVDIFKDKLENLKSLGSDLISFLKPFSDFLINVFINSFKTFVGYITDFVIPTFNFLWDVVVDVTSRILQAITPFISTILGSLQELHTAITDLVNNILLPVLSAIIDKFKQMYEQSKPYIDLFFGLVESYFNHIADVYSSIIDTITNVIESLADILRQAQPIIDMFKSSMSDALEKIQPAISNFISKAKELYSTLKEYWMVVFEELKPVIEFIGGVLGGLAAIISGVVVGAVNGLIQAFSGIIDVLSGVIEFITGFFELLIGLFTNNSEMVDQAVQKMWDGIVSIFTGAIDAIVGFVQGFVEGVIGFFEWLYDVLVGHSIVPDLMNAIIDYFMWLPNKVVDIVSNFVSSVIQVFTNLFNKAKEIFNKLKSTISSVFNSIKSIISTIANGIASTVSSKFNSIKSTVSNIVNGIKGTISSVFNSIKSTISTTVNSITSTVTSKFTTIKSKITSLINGARDAVKTAIDKMKGFFNFNFSLPKLKVPKFSISPSGWDVGDLVKGSIPKLSVVWAAKGGILDKAALIGNVDNTMVGAGEAGREAILPLDKNTEWMDEVGERVAKYTNNNLSNELIIKKLDELIDLLCNVGIYLNGDVLVGGIAPSMDHALGKIYKRK